MTNREIALSYLEKGLSIIPCKSPVTVKKSPKFQQRVDAEYNNNLTLPKPRTKDEIYQELYLRECKLPIVPWKEYQNRLPTIGEVNNWFNLNPDANIGIVTGAVSNIVVFDLDSQAAVQYAEEMGGFPEDTVRVKTSRGYHVYMRHPGFEIRNSVDKELDIDIRADGGLLIAPPSMHGSGSTYEWVEGYSIFQIDPAPCSPWMVDYLQAVSNGAGKDKPDSKPKPEIKKEAPKASINKEPVNKTITDSGDNSYTDIIMRGCAAGERNHTTTKLVGHLLKTGLKETELWELLRIWNKDKVKPPLGNDELKNIFDSIKTAEQKSKDAKIIRIDSMLDDLNATVTDYQQNYVRVPFANNNLTNLEKMMSGGFAGGRFYLFGGIPSSGKTVLLNNIADNICLNNYPVLFFSYDDGKTELRYRTFSRFSGQSIECFNNRTVSDIHSICQLPDVKLIMTLKYVVQQMIPVEKWFDLIEQIKKKHGKAPVIIVDYLRKLRTEKSSGDERLRVDNILSKLTEIAKTYNTPVIAISELARDSYRSGQRLSMASFKESGSIEYEASWLGILAAVEEGKNGEYILKENWDKLINQDGNVDLIIFKAKRGTGATGKIPLKVDKTSMTVVDRIIVDSRIPISDFNMESMFD